MVTPQPFIPDASIETCSEESLLIKLADIPLEPPKYLVEGLFEKTATSMIFGPSYSGKTFIALDLALCVSSGQDFHGHKVGCPGPVVYAAAEGRGGLVRRAAAWAKDRDVNLSALPFFITKTSMQLSDSHDVQALNSALAKLSTLGPQPALIVFDTLNRSLGSWSEKDNSDMSRLLRVAEDFTKTHGCHVCLVHHTGHEAKNRGRGASALYAGMDQSFSVSKEADDIVCLQNDKMKDGDPPKPLHFAFKAVEFNDGENLFKSSCLKATTPAFSPLQAELKQKPNDSKVEASLNSISKNGGLDADGCVDRTVLVDALVAEHPDQERSTIRKWLDRANSLINYEVVNKKYCRKCRGVRLSDLENVDPAI
jgi:hypothetical protein